MAHKKRDLSEDVLSILDGPDHYWGIDKGVGWGCKNYWDDVMLIQYLLNTTISAKLAQDGIFGPKTEKAIRKFQKKKTNGWRPWVDGKIDSANGSDDIVWNSSATRGTVYTIYLLNMSYRSLHHAYYEDLRMDGSLPPELTYIFSSWKNS